MDLVWLGNPSGKVRHILSDAQDVMTHYGNSVFHAILLLDAGIALMCQD